MLASEREIGVWSKHRDACAPRTVEGNATGVAPPAGMVRGHHPWKNFEINRHPENLSSLSHFLLSCFSL